MLWCRLDNVQAVAFAEASAVSKVDCLALTRPTHGLPVANRSRQASAPFTRSQPGRMKSLQWQLTK